MKGNLEPILQQYTFDDEGEKFEVRATEPGGAVKLGISFETFEHWWAITGRGVPTFDDLAKMTRADAVPIYDRQYWQPMMGDDLKVGVDYAVFDPVMNSGLVGGIQILQAALGLEQTGHFDLALLAAANNIDADPLIDRISEARLAHMRESPDWSKYERGWSARVARVRMRAKGMVPIKPRYSVAWVQDRLNSFGYMPPLKVDGVYGPKSVAAVKAFQTDRQLVADGIIGPKTRAALDKRI